MTLYLARLCWNQSAWSRPSGVAQNAEGTAKGGSDTFASKHGYGYEEWLFRREHVVDGWRYGFLQPAMRSCGNLIGRDAILYTIDPGHRRWYVGRIDGVEILDDEDAQVAIREFERRGWLSVMHDELSALNLSPPTWWPSGVAREYLNIRYRPERLHLLPEPLAAPKGDQIWRPGMNRYRFYELHELPESLVGTEVDPSAPTRMD